MASSTAVEAPTAQVPDLRSTPALDITAEDVALPRLHIGQFSSKAVQAKLVEAGTLYYASGQDDPDPQTIPTPLTFYVIGLRKGKSIVEDGNLQRYDYLDPDAPAGCNVTYDYSLAIPSVDASMPFKWLLTKSATPAARNMNLVLAKATRPHWEFAFSAVLAERENPKGKYWIPQVRQVEADKAVIPTVKDLAVMLAPAAPETSSTEQPNI